MVGARLMPEPGAWQSILPSCHLPAFGSSCKFKVLNLQVTVVKTRGADI